MPLLLALVVAFGMFIGAKFQDSYNITGNAKSGDPKSKIDEVLRLIDRQYVDNPEYKKISEAAITAMLKELDPHSVYIPAESLRAANEELEGNFEGIGVEFNILNDTLMIVSPLAGGPSEQLGIKAGDRIIKIDDKVVAGVGFTSEDVFKTLRGEKGTKVKVAIKRDGEPKLLDYTITRNKIPIYSVDASYMATPETGYIKISRFAATTIQEYTDAFGKLRRQGLRNLILDLRGNPGGYLKASIQLSDEFLPKGKMVVYTEGRKQSRDEYKSSSIGGFEEGKLVVLIDEGSASASEIVSGALQDWDRAIIIGRRSFGKGLVQEPFMLSDGSGLRLTVARYYTPSGRSIQKSYEKGVDEYEADILHRFEHGEQYSQDSIKFADSLKFYTLTNKRLVYGGGGIMPDIFVGADTLENSDYLTKLLTKGVFTEFVTSYIDRNRRAFDNKFKTFEAFDKGFVVDGAVFEQFVQFAEKKGVKRDANGIKISGSFMKAQIKGLIARQFFRNEGYYHVINAQNKAFQKALQVIEDDTFDKLNIQYR